jgi:predicted nuclease of predicted toxin-antitoxin system
VARLYSNENIALQVVMELRQFGHDVLTSVEAGKANAAIPDPEVLAFATAQGRILISHNRRDFLRLHKQNTDRHAGIVLCTFDPDFQGQARRIHESVEAMARMEGQLREYRGN